MIVISESLAFITKFVTNFHSIICPPRKLILKGPQIKIEISISTLLIK